MKSFLTFIFIAFVSFTTTAFAATGLEPENGSLIDLAKPVLDAIMGGQYVLAAALALILFVAVARKFGTKYFPFLESELGVALLLLVSSFGTALATALVAGSGFSAGLLWMALQVAIAAAGSWKLVKIFLEYVRPWVEKGPAWLRYIFDMVVWIFEKPGAKAIRKAEAAGKAAVSKKPGTGIDGVTGKPKNVR